MGTLNPYFLDKLTEAANEIARAGYRATIEDNALITNCTDRPGIRPCAHRLLAGMQPPRPQLEVSILNGERNMTTLETIRLITVNADFARLISYLEFQPIGSVVDEDEAARVCGLDRDTTLFFLDCLAECGALLLEPDPEPLRHAA